MTRTATTKLVATALAVASLGLASTASAAEDQGFATGEPTPGQPVPAQAQDQATQEQAPVEQQGEEKAPVEKTQEQLDQERFDRFCNMKDAEPSHSDKKFCEDFRKTHPTTTTTENGHGPLRIDCKHPQTATDAEFCRHVEPGKPGYEKPGYEKPYYHQVSEPSKGQLPFTGLQIWQLGLIGIVLVGGGIGARRLLVS